MDAPERSKSVSTDSAATSAVGSVWHPSRARIVVSLLLAGAVGAGLLFLWMPSRSQSDPPGTAATPATSPAVAAVAAATPAMPRQLAPNLPPRAPEGDADPTRDLSSYVARGDNPGVAAVIEALHQRGVHSGLGAFSPPGTSPPLVGLAVPEDFNLPKGYVRHHQATDDGQRIEAILMFAPDFQLVDANNQAIDLPKNRVVPPELAPPGLTIRRITIPAPIDPARSGR